MGPIQNFHELQSWLRRRFGMIALVTALGLALGVAAAINSDRVYSATAVLQVINPIVGGDGDTGAQRRAQIIEQRLMARDNLLAMAERHGLFADTPLTEREKVHALRQSISINGIAAPPGPRGSGSAGLSAIHINVNMGDQALVAEIANELAESLVAESAAAARDRAGQALEFYRQEEERLEAAIAALEDEITDFQIEHEDLLPESMTLRREDLRGLEERRFDIERELSQAEGERSAHEAESDRALTRRRMVALDDQIAQYRRELGLLDRVIEETRAPFRQAPAIARELAAMERRMDQLQAQLSDIVQQRRSAELGQRIEADDQSERFEVLEAAIMPDYASSRSQRSIAMLGGVAGLIGGILLAFAVEAFNPVLRTAQRMERELQLRPVISIPLTRSPRESTRRRLIWLMGLGALAIIALALAVQMMGA